jgi:hypothetical protein
MYVMGNQLGQHLKQFSTQLSPIIHGPIDPHTLVSRRPMDQALLQVIAQALKRWVYEEGDEGNAFAAGAFHPA